MHHHHHHHHQAVKWKSKSCFRSIYFLASMLLLLTVVPLLLNNYSHPINDTTELTETLQRHTDGRAAVVIIRVTSYADDSSSSGGNEKEDKYLVQLKSNDYPIEAFQGAVCLFGGNANFNDAGPKQTLLRELSEELPKSLVDAIMTTTTTATTTSSSSLSFIGTTMNAQTAKVLGKSEPYAFMCACYEATISWNDIPTAFIGKEGGYALLTREELLKEYKYAWGYDHVMSSYFGEPVQHFCEGVSVAPLSDERLKDWTPESP